MRICRGMREILQPSYRGLLDFHRMQGSTGLSHCRFPPPMLDSLSARWNIQLAGIQFHNHSSLLRRSKVKRDIHKLETLMYGNVTQFNLFQGQTTTATRKIASLCVLWRMWAPTANFSHFYLKLNAAFTYLDEDISDVTERQTEWVWIVKQNKMSFLVTVNIVLAVAVVVLKLLT